MTSSHWQMWWWDDKVGSLVPTVSFRDVQGHLLASAQNTKLVQCNLWLCGFVSYAIDRLLSFCRWKSNLKVLHSPPQVGTQDPHWPGWWLLDHSDAYSPPWGLVTYMWLVGQFRRHGDHLGGGDGSGRLLMGYQAIEKNKSMRNAKYCICVSHTLKNKKN